MDEDVGACDSTCIHFNFVITKPTCNQGIKLIPIHWGEGGGANFHEIKVDQYQNYFFVVLIFVPGTRKVQCCANDINLNLAKKDLLDFFTTSHFRKKILTNSRG